MKTSASIFWLPLIIAVWIANATALWAQPSDETAAKRQQAFDLLERGAFAEAQPVFAEVANSPRASRFDRREAGFFVDYLQLAMDLQRAGIGPWETLSDDPWGGRLRELETLAAALRSEAPEAVRWLTIHEYLGDLQTRYWWGGNEPSLGAYGAIFDYWAGSTDLTEARHQYLRLAGRLAEERELRYDLRRLLLPIIENAAQLAQTAEEVQRFQWLWAHFLREFSDRPTDVIRRGAALRQAISAGMDAPTIYHARALFDYAEWSAQQGIFSYGEGGELEFRPDYAVAAESYRILLELEDQWTTPAQVRRARQQLEWIERKDLSVMVGSNFRPDTKVHFWVEWRNLTPPEVAVFPIDPSAVAEGFFTEFADQVVDPEASLENQVLDAAPEAPHYPVRVRIGLETDLKAGAYLVEARSGDKTHREILLVSDLAVITHEVRSDLVVYAADPTTGHPVEKADVVIVENSRSDETLSHKRASTNQEGILKVVADTEQKGGDRLLVVSHPDRGMAIARQSLFPEPPRSKHDLFVYGLPERELFRPGETVRAYFWSRWKSAEGWQRVEPGIRVSYSITGPRGDVVASGQFETSQLGSGSIEFKLPEEVALGLHQIAFTLDENGRKGEATIAHFFRVEAFRTPEIKASIELDEPVGGARLSGDLLQGEVKVSYFAGGAVENAAVELVVSRQPYVRWPQPMVLEHLTENRMIRPMQPFEELQHLPLETDSRGLARFEIPTADDGTTEWTYRLEARVRDLSRHEVNTQKNVVLAQQSYFAHLKLERRLIAPGDRAALEVRLETPEGQPVSDRGTLRITRARWREIYIHRRRGDEIGAEAYRELPERSILVSAQSDYNLKEKGFVTEEVLIDEIYADAEGTSRFTFEPSEPGYYNFSWVSRGRRGQPIVAETALWVTDDATAEIGYRPGGIELIANRGPHAVGEPITVLVSTPTPNRSVLISIAGTDLTEIYRLPVQGTSQLIRFTPTDVHQPNVFVNASLIADETVFHDTLELLIPPAQQFLEVTITPDADGYEPRDEATFSIEVRDHEGKPIATEVAVSVTDAALNAIAPRLRPDVQSTFFGDRNPNRLQIGGSLQWRGFFRPLEEESQEDEADASPQAESIGPENARFSRSSAEPMAAPLAERVSKDSLSQNFAQVTPPASALVPPALTRRDFRSTAYWNPRVETDAMGQATVRFAFPDNLTEWRADALAITASTEVGEGTAQTTTRQPLIARLQTPRFLIDRDVVLLSGTFQNNSEQTESIVAQLGVGSGVELVGVPELSVEVPPQATRRLEWMARATYPGIAEMQLEAAGNQASDAVARALPVIPHGLEIVESIAGRFTGKYLDLVLELPEDAEAEVVLSVSPTIATELFSALPYLIEFPYGSVEQTLSRFLPALAVRQAVGELGYPLQTIDAGIFAGLSAEARSGRADLRELLDAVVAQSVTRLAKAQKSDGSWPWMSGGPSDLHMTAYAVHTLTIAEELGVSLGRIRLAEARDWIERTLTEADIPSSQRAWMLHALALRHRALGMGRPSRLEARAFLRLFEQRAELGPMQVALLALTAKYFGLEEDGGLLLDQLADTARKEDALIKQATDLRGRPLTLPQVHWGRTNGYFHWAEGAVETTAIALEALLALRPDHPWVEQSVTWLIRNRTGTHWQNTRATALASLALTSYLQMHGSRHGTEEWRLSVNGNAVKVPQSLSADSTWVPPLNLKLPQELLRSGRNVISLTREDVPQQIYFTLMARRYSTEEPIPAATSDLRLTRAMEHLAPVPTLLKGTRELMRPLVSDQSIVGSGQRVEVILQIETTRELRYVLIEDVKPAGFEVVQLLSGSQVPLRRVDSGAGSAGNAPVFAWQELGERTVGFLIDRIPAGRWELRYRLRTESPGDFHVLPARAEALYLPGVRANSEEFRISVE